MLPERVSEETLREIAEEIYNKDSDYDRVFIAYLLRENPQGIYWARTDYDPILNLNIMGKTTAEKEALESVDPGIVGEIIGKWDAKNGLQQRCICIAKTAITTQLHLLNRNKACSEPITFSLEGLVLLLD